MISAADFKRGLLIEVDKTPYLITDVSFQSPSARGAGTLVKVRLKNLLTKSTVEKSFKTSEKVEEPNFESNPGQFLYKEGEEFVFMDLATYEQFQLTPETLGDAVYFLKDGLDLKLQIYNGEPVGLELPLSVELAVTETDPAIKGATAAAQTKNAVLETGLNIQVPPYIEVGEIVKVDTRTHTFISRAK